MYHHEIIKPIGLAALCNEVDMNCVRAAVCRKANIRPEHLIVQLDPGSGRTTFIEYMADKYRQSGVLDFSSGLDDYIEIKLDGTAQHLRKAFSDIESAAVFDNHYTGIIAIDITEFAGQQGANHSDLVKKFKDICDHACVVFFVSSVPSRKEEHLIGKLCENISRIKRIVPEPYTRDEICALVLKTVKDRGIEIRNEKKVYKILSGIVSDLGISQVKDALELADDLIMFSDFSKFTPFLNDVCLNEVNAYRHNRELKGEAI